MKMKWIHRISKVLLIIVVLVGITGSALAQQVQEKIFIADREGEKLFMADADGTNLTKIIEVGHKPSFIDIDFDNGYIYFTTLRGRLFRMLLDGSELEMLNNFRTATRGLVVDPINQVIYISVFQRDLILKYDLQAAQEESSRFTDLVSSHRFLTLSAPAYDLKIFRDKLWWINEEFRLCNVNLDGTELNENVMEFPGADNIISPFAFSGGGRFIYHNAVLGYIGRVNVDGTENDPKFIKLPDGWTNVYGIAYRYNTIFFGNWDKSTIGACTSLGEDMNESFIKGLTSVQGITFGNFFLTELSSEDLEASINKRVSELGGINFEIGKDVLLAESKTVLDEIVNIFFEYPSLIMEITGHTDSTGNPDNNMALSDLRAQAVVKYLISQGVNEEQMAAKGYGQTSPIADNATVEGRSLNRRVEFVVISF